MDDDAICDNCGRSNPTVQPRCVLDCPTRQGDFWKVVTVTWCDHCWGGLTSSFGKELTHE